MVKTGYSKFGGVSRAPQSLLDRLVPWGFALLLRITPLTVVALTLKELDLDESRLMSLSAGSRLCPYEILGPDYLVMEFVEGKTAPTHPPTSFPSSPASLLFPRIRTAPEDICCSRENTP
jgi:hypothetical protein